MLFIPPSSASHSATQSSDSFSQAIVDGDPPDLPASGFSDTARNFVGSCLHKNAKMRPTYAMLIRHPWLTPLLQPPTISEDAEAEAEAEAEAATGATSEAPQDAAGAKSDVLDGVLTADREVARWVIGALERKRLGKMRGAQKPALHAAPLDAVPTSPDPAKEVDGSAG